MGEECSPHDNGYQINRSDEDDVTSPVWTIWVLSRQQNECAKVNNCRGVRSWSKSLNTYKVWKLDGRELSDAEDEADNCCVPLARAQENECRNYNVPHCWKPVEPHIFSFLISAGKPQRASNQDESRDCHRHSRLNDIHANQQNCWYHDTGDVVDDKV